MTAIKKDIPSSLPPVGSQVPRSDELHLSIIGGSLDFRLSFLKRTRVDPSQQPPPLISCSYFVPPDLVTHLMRNKKDGALGVKYERGDEITNMEGAMHTFVTPVLARCEMYGDYRFAGMHGVDRFGARPPVQGSWSRNYITRTVVLSDSIQLDFENREVMLQVCKLDILPFIGTELKYYKEPWKILSSEAKMNTKLRNEYDDQLRRHMVCHLTQMRMLPSIEEAKNQHRILSPEEVIQILENDHIWNRDAKYIEGGQGFLQLPNKDIVSIELLYNAAEHQARNELAALEVLCPQSYVYTYDPASIFAARIGSKILNRLMARAVRRLFDLHDFPNMRLFAFNDYVDKHVIQILDKKLKRGKLGQWVPVISKEELFRGPGGPEGLYDVSTFEEARGAMLVVHNNSDAFGQNIETESMSGSLDGAIGASSSAAAGLDRSRADLLDYCWFGKPGHWPNWMRTS